MVKEVWGLQLQLLSSACLQWHLALPECVGLLYVCWLKSFHYCLDTQKQLDIILMLNGWLELFFLLLFELSFHTKDEMDLFSNGSWFNTGLFAQVVPKYVQGDGSTWEAALHWPHFTKHTLNLMSLFQHSSFIALYRTDKITTYTARHLSLTFRRNAEK